MRLFKPLSALQEFKYAPFPRLLPIALVMASALLTNISIQNQELHGDLETAWFKATIITTLTFFTLVLIIEIPVVSKYGDKVPLIGLVTGAAILGALKGITTMLLVDYFQNIEDIHGHDIFLRGYSGMTLSAGMMFFYSLYRVYQSDVLAARKAMEDESQILADELVLIREEIMLIRTASEERIVNKILSNLKDLKELDIYASDPEKNWKNISEALHQGLMKRVREESHSLAQINRVVVPIRERIRDVLHLRILHLHPFIFSFVQISVGASVYFAYWNPRNSVLILILNTAVTLALTSFFKKFFLSDGVHSARYNLFVFFSLIISVDIFYMIHQEIVWGRINQKLAISVFFWHIFLLYVISAASEILQYLQKTKEQTASINQDLKDKKRILEEYNTRLRNDISKHLHGFLLTRVRTTAVRLDTLAQEGKFDEYKNSLKELLSEFSLDRIRERLNADQIGPDFFVEFPLLWEGLVDVTFKGDLDFYTGFQPPQLVELAQVIEEIVANANRHGGADTVEITFELLNDGDLLITGRDNGRGVGAKYKEGLGSNLFTLASDNRWSFSSTPYEGSVIQLAISSYNSKSVVTIN